MPDRFAVMSWTWTILALVALLAVTAVLFLTDRRTIREESVWSKPMKFEVSLAIHFGTLAVAAAGIGPALQDSLSLKFIVWTSIAATAVEMIYIVGMAAAQRESHFNLSTPAFAAMYAVMAAGAVLITAAAGVVGVLLAVDSTSSFSPGLRWGFVIGLNGGAILTLITAFRMGAALDRHVGRERPRARRVPLAGWSTTVADRRFPHFIATHMMQAVPACGALADAILPQSAATPAVIIVATLYAAVALWIFVRINRGIPLGFSAVATALSRGS